MQFWFHTQTVRWRLKFGRRISKRFDRFPLRETVFAFDGAENPAGRDAVLVLHKNCAVGRARNWPEKIKTL